MTRRIGIIIILIAALMAVGCSYGIIESDMQFPGVTEAAGAPIETAD